MSGSLVVVSGSNPFKVEQQTAGLELSHSSRGNFVARAATALRGTRRRAAPHWSSGRKVDGGKRHARHAGKRSLLGEAPFKMYEVYE